MKAKFITLLLLLISILLPEKGEAIPSFSRKYKTSCITCHSVYPKLTPFGESFRMNGYQFPKQEQENIKEDRVILGAEAYKKIWPDAVWPNSIPAKSPISLRGKTSYDGKRDENGDVVSEFGLPSLQFLAANTLGKDISIFLGAHLYEEGKTGNIDRFFIRFSNLLDGFLPEKSLSVRVGQFIPEVVPFTSNHRGLTQTSYAFNTYAPSQGNVFVGAYVHEQVPFGIENFQLGMEFSGLFTPRLRYVGGIINGGGAQHDTNNKKDFYGRLAYKIGGMAFDGSVKEKSPIDKEVSIALGTFAYKGSGVVGDTIDYDIHRIGADFNLIINQFNLIGGVIGGTDEGELKTKYHLFFGEASYMFYPWLIGLVRYEQAKPEEGSSINRLVPHISALVVANVKFFVETSFDPNDQELDYFAFGLDFAF